jgi:hypothetical protein
VRLDRFEHALLQLLSALLGNFMSRSRSRSRDGQPASVESSTPESLEGPEYPGPPPPHGFADEFPPCWNGGGPPNRVQAPTTAANLGLVLNPASSLPHAVGGLERALPKASLVGGAAVPSERDTLWEDLERVRQQAIQLHQRSENLRQLWGLEDERRARNGPPTSHGPDGDPSVPGWGSRVVARLGPRMAASAVAAAEAASALRRFDQARQASRPVEERWAAGPPPSLAERRARDAARFADIVQEFSSFVANPAIQQIMVESVSASNERAASSGSQERQ